jgi:GTP-binding protein HflX
MSNLRKAIIVTYPCDQVIKEAISLANAAGYSVTKLVTQRHITRSRYGIGSGKAEELKQVVKELKPDRIIYDEVLKPTQQYNLAGLCKIEVIDRERLILEIFEQRASTAESRVQIKLAQLRYELIRIREKVKLAKRGEQPGFFGLGKYDADIYYLDIKRRAVLLKEKVKKEEKRRNLYRIQRSKAYLDTISLAGYTSAGKTTLFNALTGEMKITGDRMFTTLTTFTRAMNFENNKVLVSDTVGFINKLPAYMIDAFKSTLHELTHAILILLILDISQTVEEIKKNMESSIEVLNELNIPLTRIIYLLNKMDLTTINDVSDKIYQLGLLEHTNYVLPISAKKGYNINSLKKLIAKLIFSSRVQKPEFP